MPLNDLSGSEPKRWWIDADPCPPWCEGGHHVDDLPDDRRHTKMVRLAVICPTEDTEYSSNPVSERSHLTITVERQAGGEEIWVSFELGRSGSRSFTITLESAARMVYRLQDLLSDVPLTDPTTGGSQ